MAISSGSKTPTKTPTQTFLPGQGAILTPDPTLGGAWTHTRADVPLFKNAAVTPAPGTGTGTGTGTGGTGTGGSSNPKVIDYYRDGSRRVDGVLQPRGGTWDGERGGSYFPGHTGGGSGSAWTGDGPGEQSYFPSSGSRNQAGGSDWQSRQNGSATPAAPPNYSYYGVPPSTPAAAPATPP
ncbi:MAG TPA: hypothetical protein VK196_22400, partial [Magnetospirillum sp.]|nr:hypothetical protein [Magnetospirillum sp.]